MRPGPAAISDDPSSFSAGPAAISDDPSSFSGPFSESFLSSCSSEFSETQSN